MPEGPLIFSTHHLHPEVSAQLAKLGELRIASDPGVNTLMQEGAGCEYVVVRAPIPPELIAREKGLRAMIRHGAGLDMIPVEECSAAGVMVANVPGVNARTVAEHVIWTSMALLRNHPVVNRDLRETSWEAGRGHADAARELNSRTIGIVGMGNIGRIICRIATEAFAMNVLTHTRTPASVPQEAQAASLKDLLERSDVVVLCCPLTKETRGLIDAKALDRMKPDAVLVNVSRGPVIVEADLVQAMRSGKLGGVALDVFEQQPIARDHPLFDFPNVILTPHLAGITIESMLRMGQGVVDEIARIMSGELPKNFINPECLPRYKDRFGGSKPAA